MYQVYASAVARTHRKVNTEEEQQDTPLKTKPQGGPLDKVTFLK
jgi:hypothetical protein